MTEYDDAVEQNDAPDDALDPSEYAEIPEPSEQLDQDPFQPDVGFDDGDVDDVLDEGLTTPEGWSGLIRNGPDETMDQRLDEERSDDTVPIGEPPITADRGSGDATDELDSAASAAAVGDERAGRLVSPDHGIGEGREPELFGEDVGVDGAAASAEEAAVHLTDDEPAERDGSA
ncbi:DUF5709 domain-containing protein [Microlunatus soli]|uniref:DUF5709 domain-containing protein n=1 Tax=Microlunatus soli TaxID=630515 RepID=A0A1H1NB18_9ACTN|nr:DUF5709 domain-containing protein [Microlunatus soli]SDR96117.1 hypothetical protein SAMN04489812_0453 [Microlunatus soli]